MKRWFLGLLAISAVVVAVMLALARPGGSGNHQSLAHMITEPPEGPYAAIDADVTNGMCWTGTTPGENSIDATANVTVGATHDIAVCFGNFPAPVQPPDLNANGVAVFSMTVHYNSQLNSCVDKPCSKTSPCTEDDMPDLNEGSTLGQGVPTSPDMGGGWTCNAGSNTEPSCLDGVATIDCYTTSGPFPPTGDGIAFPFFAVTFHADNPGVDNLTLTNGAVNSKTDPLGSCNPIAQGEPELTCIGAAVWKGITPTPSPTITPTPVFTPTITPTPTPNADMGVTLADDPDPVIVGENVVYTATVTNNGPNLTTGVELVVTLPTAKDYVSDDCSCVENPAQTLTCDLGAMDVDDVEVCNITATALTEGIHETDASVSSALLPDPDLDNNEASEETTEVLPHAYIDKVDNGDGWCDIIDDDTTEIVGATHQLAVCVEYLPEYVHEFDLTISYDDSLDTCGDNEIECPVGTGCLDDNPDANDGDMIEWGGVSLGSDWDCTVDADVGEPTCNLNSEGTHGPHAGKAWIRCFAKEGSTTTLDWGALAVLTLDVAAAGVDDVEIYSLQIWGDEAIIAQCLPPTPPQGIVGAALPMDCDGATDTKVVPTATPTATNTPTLTPTPTITPTPEPETHKRETKTPTPAPTETATPVPPTVPPPPPPPPPPTATPFGGVGPEIVAPTTGSGSPVGGFAWAIWLAAGIAGAAAAGGFYFRYTKKAR